MALADIELDFDKLRDDVIAKNTNELSYIDEVMVDICNVVATLTAMGWEGVSKESFMDKFNEFKKDMRIYYENLKSFNVALSEIADKAESVYRAGDGLIAPLVS